MQTGPRDDAFLDDNPMLASYARWRGSPLGRITDQLEEQLLLELIGDPCDLDVLDVGCGDGLLASTLAQRGARVTGVDSDPRMLRAAAQRARRQSGCMRFDQGDAQALPYADASFDRVIAVAMLCFVPDANRAVREMARVLRPDGELVLGELGPWSLWSMVRRVRGLLGHPVWSEVHYRSANALTALCEAQGLEVMAKRGAIYYPPLASIARIMRQVDPWLGQRTTTGATFIAVMGRKRATMTAGVSPSMDRAAP